MVFMGRKCRPLLYFLQLFYYGAYLGQKQLCGDAFLNWSHILGLLKTYIIIMHLLLWLI